jgi:transcriptional regulator with GAF, ATPase, and Fis domain
VLVHGETGVGKELAAAALHAWSPRRRARLVALNCAALPEPLLESELFGHERGAFTGAAGVKEGYLEAAAGGTVLLDEVGDCSPEAQAKLLRALETKRITRVGSTVERPIDVRIVAATNRPLEDEVAAGRFRRDLFFRLSAATVVIPPLRDRPLDLPLLARHFLGEARSRLGRPPLALTPAALALLCEHRWPGNVRELKNAMDFVAVTTGLGPVEVADLPSYLLGRSRNGPPSRRAAPAPRIFRNLYDEIRELERTRMQEALTAAGGVRVTAAALIGMPLRTFVTKLKEHGLSGIPAARRRSVA